MSAPLATRLHIIDFLSEHDLVVRTCPRVDSLTMLLPLAIVEAEAAAAAEIRLSFFPPTTCPVLSVSSTPTPFRTHTGLPGDTSGFHLLGCIFGREIEESQSLSKRITCFSLGCLHGGVFVVVAVYPVVTFVVCIPQVYAWQGGALLASTPDDFGQYLVTRKKYEENGHAYCETRFPVT
ncbi:Actin-related protein 6 [Taenia solium]|eukprot:TsM_000791800 transcript=TsM_000791800 gene=TsM_000791800